MNETGDNLPRILRQIQVKRIDLNGIPLPAHRLAVDCETQVHKLRQRTARTVITRQPLWKQQRQPLCARSKRNRLRHLVGGAGHIGGIYVELDRAARPGRVDGTGHGRARHFQSRRLYGVCGRSGGQRKNGEDHAEHGQGSHAPVVPTATIERNRGPLSAAGLPPKRQSG